MSEKTAMTLMVEHMAGLLKIEDNLIERYKYWPDAVEDIKKNWEQLNAIKEIAMRLLEKEKQQIISSHNAGCKYGQQLQVEARGEVKYPSKMNAEQYYTQTYKHK